MKPKLHHCPYCHGSYEGQAHYSCVSMQFTDAYDCDACKLKFNHEALLEAAKDVIEHAYMRSPMHTWSNRMETALLNLRKSISHAEAKDGN